MTHRIDGRTSPQVSLERIAPEQKVKEGQIQLTEAEPLEELPDTHAVGGNTMKALEDLLWKKCGEDLGFDTSKPLLDDKQRDDFLKKVRGHIKGFHGKLPRKDPNNLESPIQFETYRQSITSTENGVEKTTYGVKSLKMKMQWKIEVEINGKTKIIEADQYIKTGSYIPDGLVAMQTSRQVRHAKHTALLRAKFIRNLHKRAFLGEAGELGEKIEKKVYDDRLVQNLRAPQGFKITHYPNPLTYKSSHGLRWNTQGLQKKDGAAYSSTVRFKDGQEIEIVYSSSLAAPGRTRVKTLKRGDVLPDGRPVDKPGTHFHKVWMHLVEKENEKEVLDYGQHLYEQAGHSTVKDPELEAYNNLVTLGGKEDKAAARLKAEQAALNKNWSKDLGEEPPKLTLQKWKEYEETCFYGNKSSFEETEKVLNAKLLQRESSPLQQLLGIGLKKRVIDEADKYNKLIEELERAKKELKAVETDEEKKRVLDQKNQIIDDLKKAYESDKDILTGEDIHADKDIHADIKKMQNLKDNMKTLSNDIEKLATKLEGADKAKKIGRLYEAARESIKNHWARYKPLSEALNKAEKILK